MPGRFSLDPALAGELRGGTFGGSLLKLVQTIRRGGKTVKTSLRRVEIGGREKFQAETREAGGAPVVKNLEEEEARRWFEDFLAQEGARDVHLMTATGDLHVRVTRKGRALVSRSAEQRRDAAPASHDREKVRPLDGFDSAAYLETAGLAGRDGEIRASMRGKYRQVNEFLRIAAQLIGGRKRDEPFRIVDCGCGKAYLTLALHLYLTRALGFANVRTTGVDRREDVTAAAREAAERLDLAGEVDFVQADLAGYDAGKADLVVSLHACDTATDEALAKAVEWKAGFVLSAPCCQHELQKGIAASGGPFAALLRQSILRERMCDLLTDAFRAQIMRILGYRTQVAEFVDAEATARNIMLRCEWGVKPGQGGTVAEYLALRDFWRVVPWLETRLRAKLAPLLGEDAAGDACAPRGGCR